MIITSVISVDKRKCKVFLEEGFAFVLYKGEADRFGLFQGGTLSEEVYNRIVELLIKRGKDRALYLLQSQNRTKVQMEQRLQKDGYPLEIVEQILAFLTEYHLIDDKSFVETYISLNSSKKSRRQMIYELQQKGVKQEDIEQALEETPLEEVLSARKLLCKRLKGKKQVSYEERCRLAAYLGRKGYSYDTIYESMSDLETEEGYCP